MGLDINEMRDFDELVDKNVIKQTKELLKKVDEDIAKYDIKMEKYNDYLIVSKDVMQWSILHEMMLLEHPRHQAPEKKYELILELIHMLRMYACKYKIDFEKNLKEELK